MYKRIPLKDSGVIPPITGGAKAVMFIPTNYQTKELLDPVVNIVFPTDECIVGKTCDKCFICGRQTNLVSIGYEMRVCSQECLEVMDKHYREWEQSCLEEEF